MALSSSGLSTLMQSKIAAVLDIEDTQQLELVCDAISEAVVEHIVANGVLVNGLVTSGVGAGGIVTGTVG